MGKYKRFVAYVYEYEEKRKGNNRGFVRVEARNGNCSMEFQLSGIDMEQEFAELSGFSKEGEKTKRIPLAACMVRGDVFRYRMETNALHMGESNMALEDLDGLVLIGPRHVYGTCWSGEEIPTDMLSMPGEEVKEVPEERMELEEKTDDPVRSEEVKILKETEEAPTPQIYDTIVYNLDGNEETGNQPQHKDDDLHNTRDDHWAYMQSQFPHLDPFADGGLTECIKITPADMTYLQEQDWKLGNNNFLLHGYYSYRYLLLGRKEGTDTYVLGVPGIYDHQEKFMANMFGFPQFKVAEPARMKMGQFGYWYREIH